MTKISLIQPHRKVCNYDRAASQVIRVVRLFDVGRYSAMLPRFPVARGVIATVMGRDPKPYLLPIGLGLLDGCFICWPSACTACRIFSCISLCTRANLPYCGEGGGGGLLVQSAHACASYVERRETSGPQLVQHPRLLPDGHPRPSARCAFRPAPKIRQAQWAPAPSPCSLTASTAPLTLFEGGSRGCSLCWLSAVGDDERDLSNARVRARISSQ